MLNKYLLNRWSQQLCSKLSSEGGQRQPQWEQSPFVLAKIKLLEGFGSSNTKDSHLLWDRSDFPTRLLHRYCACPQWLQPSGIHGWQSTRCVHIPVWEQGAHLFSCEMPVESNASSDRAGVCGPTALDSLVAEMLWRKRENGRSGIRGWLCYSCVTWAWSLDPLGLGCLICKGRGSGPTFFPALFFCC